MPDIQRAIFSILPPQLLFVRPTDHLSQRCYLLLFKLKWKVKRKYEFSESNFIMHLWIYGNNAKGSDEQGGQMFFRCGVSEHPRQGRSIAPLPAQLPREGGKGTSQSVLLPSGGAFSRAGNRIDSSAWEEPGIWVASPSRVSKSRGKVTFWLAKYLGQVCVSEWGTPSQYLVGTERCTASPKVSILSHSLSFLLKIFR